MGPAGMAFGVLTVMCMVSAALGSTPATGPLRVHPRNPRYFADPSGKAVYLTGSHTWQSLQDGVLPKYTVVKQPFGYKACLLDTDHIGWKIFINDADFTRAWVWKAFTRGHSALLMENLADSPGWVAGRAAMGHTRRYAERIDLAAMTPQDKLASTGYCLANPGSEYLVYLPSGGKVTVDLSAAKGELAVEWFDPKAGKSKEAGAVQGGAPRELAVPFHGDAVLLAAAAGSGEAR